MFEQLRLSLPFLPVSLLLIVLGLIAPLLEESGRRRLIALYGLAALGLVVWAVQHAGELRSLDVVNPFPQGPEMHSVAVHVETVTAAGWEWPIALAVFFALAAFAQLARLRLGGGEPSPIARPLLVALVLVTLRLVLEKCAAPAGLVWSIGGSIGLPILVGFAGWFAGRRGDGVLRFLFGLVLFTLLHRAAIVAFAWFATTKQWGTHLDVSAVIALNTPLGGERFVAGDARAQWTWAIVVPQFGLWGLATMALGVVVGLPAWLFGRRG